MKRIFFLAAVAGAVATGMACGKDSEPVTPAPDELTRDLPSQSVSPGQDNPPYVAQDDAGAGDAGYFCCDVAFAFKPPALTDAVSVSLKGETFPLNLQEGLAMSVDNAGVWRATVCLPSTYGGSYFYEVSVAGGEADGGVYVDPYVNPNAPVETDAVNSSVNTIALEVAESCSELDVGVHSDVSVPDAGTPGGPPTKSVITGACDTLSAPTVGMTSDNGNIDIDEASTAVTALPFGFSFFGSAVTHWSAASNGFLMFHTSAAGVTNFSAANSSLPTAGAPDGIVAAFWSDLTYVNTTQLVSQVFGSAPTRHLTVEWRDFTPYLAGPSMERLTFQVKLFEGTNAIELHYCALDANGNTAQYEQGAFATVGVESLDGTQAVQHSHLSPVLTTANGLKFE